MVHAQYKQSFPVLFNQIIWLLSFSCFLETLFIYAVVNNVDKQPYSLNFFKWLQGPNDLHRRQCTFSGN